MAQTYLHKTECIRLDAEPEPWPPEPGTIDPDPVAGLDQTYAALLAQFDAHVPADHAPTWNDDDQTVGFWIRRMAQETVIHRVDAELALGVPVTEVSPVPEDLAVDGIDELLSVFMAFASVSYPEEFGGLLDAPDERPLALISGEHAWSVRATKKGILIEETSAAAAGAEAIVAASAQHLLLWLWNRADDTTVACDGDAALLDQFHALRAACTR